MYLLKPNHGDIYGSDHINLHSTMYLLKLTQSTKLSKSSKFTFHYVSIKTSENLKKLQEELHLHSTMYLLKLVF